MSKKKGKNEKKTTMVKLYCKHIFHFGKNTKHYDENKQMVRKNEKWQARREKQNNLVKPVKRWTLHCSKSDLQWKQPQNKCKKIKKNTSHQWRRFPFFLQLCYKLKLEWWKRLKQCLGVKSYGKKVCTKAIMKKKNKLSIIN